jgi:hypothetical protein
MNPHCDLCGAECIPEGCTTGYGMQANGTKICFLCCAVADALTMEATGKATFYLTLGRDGQHRVSNWPGTLNFKPHCVRKGRHNIARTRYDVYFRCNGAEWHGIKYGENTQIVHCKRTKVRYDSNGYAFTLR